MPDMIQITRELAIPLEEVELRASRASGPGGQGVNTTDSRVELRFDLANSTSLPPEVKERAMRRLASRLDSSGRLRVVAQTQRSQLANRRDAIERFAALLADAVAVPRSRKATRPSAAATARRVEGKRRRSATKRLRRPPASPED
jgi:ribosome-associated protein